MDPDAAERIRQLTDELARKERELVSAQARLDRVLHHPVMRAYSRLRRLPGMSRVAAARERRHQRDVMERTPAAPGPAAPPTEPAGFEERVTWIFSTGRSGSTWFMRLLAEHADVVAMHEPWIGHHLAPFNLFMQHPDVPGDFFSRMRKTFRDDPDYFFSAEFSDRWRPALRDLLRTRLEDQVRYALPARGPDDTGVRLVVREPNAAWAAETIMSLQPRARMIFLSRDGRDVLDSLADGYQHGGWLNEEAPKIEVTDENRRWFLESNAIAWVAAMDAVQRAFDGHRPEDRLMVRYEELLDDTPRVLADVLSWLGVAARRADVDAAVERHAFGARESTGTGRPQRAATPGLWRESFSDDEQAMIDRVMGPTLARLGY